MFLKLTAILTSYYVSISLSLLFFVHQHFSLLRNSHIKNQKAR
jgi:hypothetical protein